MIRAKERTEAQALSRQRGRQLLLVGGAFLRLREDPQLHRVTIAPAHPQTRSHNRRTLVASIPDGYR
jgi:hypothetical protein